MSRWHEGSSRLTRTLRWLGVLAIVLAGSNLASCGRSSRPQAEPDPVPPTRGELDPESADPKPPPADPLPGEVAPTVPAQMIQDPETGATLIANEVLLIVREGTTRQRIETLVGAIGGTIVGTTGRTLQVRFPGDGTRAGVDRAIKALSAFPETEVAEPNFVVELDGG